MSCCQPSSTRRSPLVFLLPLVLIVLAGMSWLLEPGEANGGIPPDSSQVLAAVTYFHQALKEGDGEGALALLSPDAVIVENGGVETRSEYAAHHLEADMAFAGTVARTSEVIHVVVTDSSAWVTSATETHGTYRDRAVDSRGAETVILRKSQNGWKISTIHWSSRDE